MKKFILTIAALLIIGLSISSNAQSFKSLKDKAKNASEKIKVENNQSNNNSQSTTNNNQSDNNNKPVLTKPENIKKENVLIAVGKPVYGQAQGCIFRSIDNGTSWQKVVSSFDYTPVGVAFGNDRFVAISSNKVAISFTGEEDSWTEADISKTYVSSGTFDPVSIAFGNGFFVICGSAGTLCYSKDGLDWKYIGEPDDMNVSVSHFKNVEFINGKFYVAGNCNRISTLIIKDEKVVIEKSSKFSTDAGDYCSFIAFNGTNYLGGRFSFFKSKDGINWKQYEPTTNGSSKLIKAFCLTNGMIIAAKEMGGMSFSKDNGSSWENASGIAYDAANAPHITALCNANGKFVAIGLQTGIWTSSNGTSWTETSNNAISESRLFGIAYAEIGK